MDRRNGDDRLLLGSAIVSDVFLWAVSRRIHARWVDGHASNLIVKTPPSAVVLPGDRIALYFTPDAMILLTG